MIQLNSFCLLCLLKKIGNKIGNKKKKKFADGLSE